jgi:cytochrome c oxidase accessory protein FixG
MFSLYGRLVLPGFSLTFSRTEPMSNVKKAPKEIDYDAFRDHIGTVDDQGRRNWIFPKKPKGRFTRARNIVAGILLTLLFAGPFLQVNGRPFLLFNILERKFILFGVPFWPQDFHLFMLALVTMFVFVVLFTVVYGRVWCGWACPQTIFMENVFRKIEYWIEGDRPKQMKLDRQRWNREKIIKKGSKWVIFAVLSVAIGNLVMAYIVGINRLADLVIQPPAENLGLFTGVMVFSAIFFFVFAWFREQACIAVCPYGRLQSVLLVKDSIVVHYDHVRGEPRERVRKGQERQGGDCIECGQCVQVCPTGIDIRNGTQMECVNCTACIDACDEIMDKVGFERGLIRYASYSQIEEGKPFKFTTRIAAYSVVLVVLLGILTVSLASRSDVEATILRTPGVLYQESEDGYISNLYNTQIVNKTMQDMPLEFRLISPENGRLRLVGQPITNIEAQDIAKGAFFIDIPKDELKARKNEIEIEVRSGDRVLEVVTTNFLGPMQVR